MAKLIYVSDVSLDGHTEDDQRLAGRGRVVYSTTLDAVSTAKTRLERNFEPATLRDMKTAATSDLTSQGARTSRRTTLRVVSTIAS